MLPLLALGALACLFNTEHRLRRLLLVCGGASVALVGPFLGEGLVYPPQMTIFSGWFPERELTRVATGLFQQVRWDLTGLVVLAGCAWWRALRDGKPVIPTGAGPTALLVAIWVAGWYLFLITAQMVTVTDPIGGRLLAPASAVTEVVPVIWTGRGLR